MGLQAVLLAILSKEPNTGYGVGRLLRQDLRHLWDARLQQIYGELAKLEAKRLVYSRSIALQNRPAKKVYALTPEGERLLDDWLTGQHAPLCYKDDLTVRLLCLHRTGPEAMLRRIEERLDESQAEMDRVAAQLLETSRTDPEKLGLLITLQAAYARAEGEATWCRKAAVLLTERQQPAVDREASRSEAAS